jgi:hypothetical protein
MQPAHQPRTHPVNPPAASGGLKTGSQSAFALARLLYFSAGFTPFAPFGDHRPRHSHNSIFMTLTLECPDSAVLSVFPDQSRLTVITTP